MKAHAPIISHAIALLAVLALAGCSTLPRTSDAVQRELARTDLATAEKLLLRADRIHHTNELEDEAIVLRLRAGEIAWRHLASGPPGNIDLQKLSGPDRQMLDILARASLSVAETLLDKQNHSLLCEFAGFQYQLTADESSVGVWSLSQVHSIQSARSVPRKILHNWYDGEGVGEPLVITLRKTQDPNRLRFTPNRGYVVTASALLTYPTGKPNSGSRKAILKIVDPTIVQTVPIGQRTFPTAYDLTAPLYSRVAGVPELLRSLTAFFIADRTEARLLMMEPFDPDKIPLVLVHGLISNPLMWRDVVNEIRANDQLRNRYQVWAFFYPTGWPITFSASKLREEIHALEATFGNIDEMVFVGHSMGGLLTRLQMISPGRTLWDAQFDKEADVLFQTLPADHLARRLLLFEANDDIERAIFISTPHRGSEIADFSIVRMVQKFVRLPGQIMRTIVDMPFIEIDRHQFNSLSSLSPSNPVLHGMDQVPILVPYHSIIGDRGRGDSPNSSDGVVAYWSSHIEGAESELIVPSDHGAHDDPAAIAELERILTLHAGLAPQTAEKPPAMQKPVSTKSSKPARARARRSASRHPARQR